MKYIRAYEKWIMIMVITWIIIYIDSSYDYKKVPVDFRVMVPKINPEEFYIIRAVNSIKDLRRNRSIVRFMYQMKWGESGNPKSIFLYSRVVALEGDWLKIEKGEVFINGEKRDMPQIKDVLKEEFTEEILIPRGHIYVLNDSRKGSLSYNMDSRMLGPIPFNLVVGVMD